VPRALVPAAAICLTLLTGCTLEVSSSDAPPASPAPSVPATPAVEPGTPDTGVPQADATPPPAPAVTFADARQAADHLIAAWRRGDRAAALQAAGPNTVRKVFALPKPAVDRVEGCDTGADSGDASYAYRCYHLYEGGSSHFWINAHAVSGWRVENFTQHAD
jgi:hypothetical protein